MSELQDVEYAQYVISPNNRGYTPALRGYPKLPSAHYCVKWADGKFYFEEEKIASDDLIIFDQDKDYLSKVYNELQLFWSSEDKFRKLDILYKRGILLYGVQGSGKSCLIKIVQNYLIQEGGVSVSLDFCQPLQEQIQLLRSFREIEKNRPLLVIMEEIDAFFSRTDDASKLLRFLDGDSTIDNIVIIATTNNPEELKANILNRPGRFDTRIEIGLPNEDTRYAYLLKKLYPEFPKDCIKEWSRETHGLGFSHLREVVARCGALGESFHDVLADLREMDKEPKVKTKEYGSLPTPALGFAGTS